jgi:hypothetical protein
MQGDRQAAVAGMVGIKDKWVQYFKTWYGLFYSLGVGTIVLSTLIAAQPKWLGWSADFYGLLAWVLAVVAGLNTFLNPAEKGDRYRRAWSGLNTELTRYNADPTYTVNHVLDAYNQGEAIIHQAPPSAH